MEVLIVNCNLDTKAEMKKSAALVFENIQSLIAVLRVNKTQRVPVLHCTKISPVPSFAGFSLGYD